MKAAVIGAGGVGGFLASVLARKYDDVTLVARGARGEAIKKNGLVMDSDQFGTVVTHPAIAASVPELGDQDLIFVCVKNYSLDEVCQELKSVVKPETILMPVMNGVDPGERIRSAFPDNIVIDSLIYIISYSLEDYSIRHASKFGVLPIGIMHPNEQEKKAVEAVYRYLLAAGSEVSIAEDIQCEIWRKFILNCSFNVATARYNTTIGPLREDPAKAQDFEALTREAYELGLALGVNLKPEHLEYVIWRFYHEYAYDASSSFQRDVADGKRTEIETFSGYVVKTAEKPGIEVPVSKKYYRALKERN